MTGNRNIILGEVWKDIPDYEDLYQVSNMGRIRAFAKLLDSGAVKQRFSPMRIIKPVVQHSGYAHVGLWRKQTCKQVRVHRLVASAFCLNDDPENKTQINHLNENKLDNRAENLAWVTAKENTNYGGAIARRVYGREKAVSCFSLSGEFLRTFKSMAEANTFFHVSRKAGHIAACCRGKQKTAYGFKWSYT